jgi:hypothetical protein
VPTSARVTLEDDIGALVDRETIVLIVYGGVFNDEVRDRD